MIKPGHRKVRHRKPGRREKDTNLRPRFGGRGNIYRNPVVARAEREALRKQLRLAILNLPFWKRLILRILYIVNRERCILLTTNWV